MAHRRNSSIQMLSPRRLVPVFLILIGLVSGCTTGQPNSPAVDQGEIPQNGVEDVFTPAPQELEDPERQISGDDTAQLFSSDQLGLCFSYTMGYTPNPFSDTVAISGPDTPDAVEPKVHFWLEISDAYDRSTERIADEDMDLAVNQQGVPRANIGWSGISLGGEQAVVLDGMPGQDLQRRVYAVHDETLYVLAFMPARSDNQAVSDQMEALYAAITNSWSWSPCSEGE